jgi:replicative DNA helicase
MWPDLLGAGRAEKEHTTMDTRDDAPHGDYSADVLKALQTAIDNTAKERRQVEALGAEVTKEQIQALLSSARSAFAQLYRDYGGHAEAAPVVTLADLAGSYWDEVKKRRQGISTSLPDLDKAMGGGFQPGKLVILLGAPGSGKTTLANQMAEHIADAGRPVFYMTSEDTPGMLLAKTLARVYNIPYSAVLGGYKAVEAEIIDALEKVRRRTSAQRLAYLHDTGALNMEQLQERASAHFQRFPESEQGGSGVLVVDYLQRLARSLRRIGGRAEELRAAVTDLTEQLRAVAMELDCTVLALASQNRASGYKDGDAMASAKESGDIEYTADVILALAAPEKAQPVNEHKPMNLRLVKNRLGESDKTLPLDFYTTRQQFTVGSKV